MKIIVCIAVIIISHDPYLIEACADRLILVADGAVTAFDGDVAEYRQYLLNRARDERRADKAEANENGEPARPEDKGNRKALRQQAAEKRKAAAPIKREIENLEKQMEKLTARRDKIKDEMADPALYEPDNATKLTTLQKDLGKIENELAEIETRWMEKQEEYEQKVA